MHAALSHAGPRLARVAAAHGLGGAGSALAAAGGALAAPLAAVEADLHDLTAGGRVSARAARHLVRAGGKRVRPALLLLAHRAAGGRSDDPRPARLATVAEAIHGATLLHDDVIDQGDVRRGAPSARAVYGNAASVLGGDLLLVRALATVAEVDARLTASVLDVLARMIDAEALQLERRGTASLSEEEYRAVVLGKTASLFEWAASAGALLAGADPGPLARYGREVGVAFQVADDALDLAGDAALAGKDLLADVREGKATWPLIHALRADPSLAPALEDAARGGAEPEASAALCARVRAAAIAAGGLAAAEAEVRARTASALEALGSLPPSPERDALAGLAAALAGRRS